jgi:hypothetical protein
MNDSSHHSNSAPVVSYGLASRQSSLVKIGGALGIAASFIGLAAFLVASFGFEAAFMLAPLALVLATVGFVLVIVGGVLHKHVGNDETQPVAALFVCIIGIVAGAVEMMFFQWKF